MMASNTHGPIIEMTDASKVLNGQAVVNEVNLSVSPGQVFGLIGPSGSGKTTLVLMMAGIRMPTFGRIRVFGVEPANFTTRLRERMGYMPQGFFLYPTLTAWENLSHVASLYGMGWLRRRKLIRAAFRELGLWEARDRLARELSGGMMRRLELAAVLIHNPDLAFIDEPMEGLDPLLRQDIWRILQDMRDRGGTVFMTTHNMSEAERCDGLALISQGRLLANGTPGELRRTVYGGDIIRLVIKRVDAQVYSALESLSSVTQVDIRRGNEVNLITEDAEETLPRVVEAIRGLNIDVSSVQRYEPPFDEVFEGLVRRD